MKITYVLNKELTTHCEAQTPLIKELKARENVNLNVKYYNYGEENTRIKEIVNTNKDSDVFVADIISPVSKEVKEIGKLFVFVPHGISAFKPFGPTDSCSYVDMFVLPTEEWCSSFRRKDAEHFIENTILSNSYGWSKLDIFFNKLKSKEKIKRTIYKKYNLKHDKPLIVYAPTGLREGAGSIKEWKELYDTEDDYIHHGSYYLKDVIVEEIKKTGNNCLVLPHPCVERGEIDKDKINILISSDMLISDISSMAIEYLSLDKPIILLKRNVEDRTEYDFKLFSELDRQIIDLGDIIGTRDLLRTIRYRLVHDRYKNVRKYWSQKLLGIFDGNASKRMADLIVGLKNENNTAIR